MEAQRKRKKLFSTEEEREMVKTVEGPVEELSEALHCRLQYGLNRETIHQ